MGDIQFHDVANFWPLLKDEDFDKLVEDIRENGQLVPIQLWEGKIIDGRNRYRACLLASVEPECVAVDLSGRDIIAYVRSLNDVRRHMTPSQLAMCAARARKWYDDEARNRQKTSTGGNRPQLVANLSQADSGKSRDKAGEAFGVSGSSVDFGTRVLNRDSDKLINAVDSGKVAVSTAARAARLPDEQLESWLDSAKGRPAGREQLDDEDDCVPVKGFVKTEQFAMECAKCAITQLQEIPKNNPGMEKAFRCVEKWIAKQRSKS